jgi:hypothetical protein
LKTLLIIFTALLISISARAEDSNFLDDFDPASADAEKILAIKDLEYKILTGESPYVQNMSALTSCYRNSCKIWADVHKDEQKLYLYVNGALQSTWLVSTGSFTNTTPDFDQHPNGRLYDAHTSSTHPGGNYNGLGNMPYAVFIEDGYAIHGTTQGNWSKLGTRASHGCVRVHPDNAKIFISLVRQYGIDDVWITVQ